MGVERQTGKRRDREGTHFSDFVARLRSTPYEDGLIRNNHDALVGPPSAIDAHQASYLNFDAHLFRTFAHRGIRRTLADLDVAAREGPRADHRGCISAH
jgi:hypothetical protein